MMLLLGVVGICLTLVVLGLLAALIETINDSEYGGWS